MLSFTLSFPFSGNFSRCLLYFAALFTVASADFHPTTVKDHVMVREVYRVFNTKDWMSCLLECNGDSQCSSYNFELEADSCPGHICELSKCAMNEKKEKGLIARRGFVFQQLKPSQNEDLCKSRKKTTQQTQKSNSSYSGLGSSAILKSRKNSTYFEKLLEFLGPKNGTWKRCYRSGAPGINASSFHKKCDDKGATVTIVRVGKFVFGGYIDVPWNSSRPCDLGQSSDQAFLFSLYSHHDGFKPRQFAVKDNDSAVYHCSSYGPSFGFDLCILPARNTSFSSPMFYAKPPSCKAIQLCTFYTGQTYFTPSDVEVFYRSK